MPALVPPATKSWQQQCQRQGSENRVRTPHALVDAAARLMRHRMKLSDSLPRISELG